MKLAELMKLIQEELEVVLTNQEAGEVFGEDVQRQLEEDEAAEEQGGFFSDSAEEEAAEGEQAMPGAIASLAEEETRLSVPVEQVVADIERTLEEEELSPEARNELETILHFILKGRLG